MVQCHNIKCGVNDIRIVPIGLLRMENWKLENRNEEKRRKLIGKAMKKEKSREMYWLPDKGRVSCNLDDNIKQEAAANPQSVSNDPVVVMVIPVVTR